MRTWDARVRFKYGLRSVSGYKNYALWSGFAKLLSFNEYGINIIWEIVLFSFKNMMGVTGDRQ